MIRRNIMPAVWMAPRGLITILLFYSIPEALVSENFNTGILLLVILASSITMAIALIRYRKQGSREVELEIHRAPEEPVVSENRDTP